MSPALWGFIGTLVGAATTIGGNVVVSILQRSNQKLQADEQAEDKAREEKKHAYLRFLNTARSLRYHARDRTPRSAIEVRELERQLSIVQYEIELIAPSGMVAASKNLRSTTRAYIKEAQIPASGSPFTAEEHRKRIAARDAADAFIASAGADLRR
jgi:hypothetical protein